MKSASLCFLEMYGIEVTGKTAEGCVMRKYSPTFTTLSHVELNSDSTIYLQKKLLCTICNCKWIVRSNFFCKSIVL